LSLDRAAVELALIVASCSIISLEASDLSLADYGRVLVFLSFHRIFCSNRI